MAAPPASTPPTELSAPDYRALVEQVQDYAMFVLDLEGNVASWNRGAQNIKHYAPEEIIGQHFSIFYTAEDLARGKPARALEAALATGHVDDEGWRVRRDGSRFWAFVSISLLRDEQGRPKGFAKVTRDLTERRKAEETARELERQNNARMIAEAAEARVRQERERFRTLSRELDGILEGVVDGITVQDRTGRLLFANSAAASQIGFASREELLVAAPSELIRSYDLLDEHANLVAPHAMPGRRVLAGEAQATALLRIRERKTGREWWSHIRANGIKGADGSTEMAISIWHDVSDERRREEHERYLNQATDALARSLDYESTLATLANLLVPGLCDWCAIHLREGDELRTVAVAHADPRKQAQAQQYLEQYPPNRAEPRGVWHVIRTGEPVLHREVPEAALRANAQDDEHFKKLTSTGMRSLIFVPIRVRDLVSGTLSLIATESGRRYDGQDLQLATELGRRVGAFIDNALLFERAQLAAASAEAAVREAEAAGRLKDEFLATVSHELRTPLNAILGWATLLKTRRDTPSIDKGIDVIHRNAKAQSKLIEDILDVSRIITGQLRLEVGAVDLLPIVSDALEVVRPSALAQGIKIEVRAPAEPVLLAGDPQRLQQVLWNLLSNAVKFNVPNGNIVVQVEQHGTQVNLAVSDDGKGIELDFLPYVFERFKQADGSTTRRFGGLGLGLAIVRHIVELHGGTVSVSSDGPSRGAKFSISLPIRAALPPPEQSGDQPSASSGSGEYRAQTSLQGIRVLVVDDERDARELLDVVLTQAGAEVQMAASVNEALAQLTGFPADIVVSDIGMPDQDGYTLIGRLNALAPPGQAIPAIALTAYTRSEDQLRALSLGFAAHVGKPVNPSDLIECIARLVPRG